MNKVVPVFRTMVGRYGFCLDRTLRDRDEAAEKVYINELESKIYDIPRNH